MNDFSEIELRRQLLARALDCFTSSELRALAGITEATEVAWRKRGTGPAYILFGTEYFYPRKSVMSFMEERIRGGHSHVAHRTL